MKLIGYIAVIVISACPFFYSQSIGFSAGYGAVNMNGVNTLLDQVRQYYSGYGIYSKPEKVESGLFLEGSFRYAIGDAGVGLLFDHISSSGSFGFSIPEASDQENFDVSTNELMALLEFTFGEDTYVVRPFVGVAGGIGFASAEFNLQFRNYQYPENNTDVNHSLSGQYFAGRIKGGLQFFLQPVILEVAVGYRIAEAGALKGDQKINDATFNNVELLDVQENPVKFNYSGFVMTAGIAVRLW